MHPNQDETSNNFDDSASKIAIFKGDQTNWYGQTHPLIVVFKNFALEGSNLQNVQAGYDATSGNFLSFEVKNFVTNPSGEKLHPRKDLFNWTSRFSKEKLAGSPYEKITSGRGWRMAVILNGYVVSAPTLDSALKDSARITGHFTQREVRKLESDLKAGSLTFTPHILSEKNISPELGLKERSQGILATIIALIAVIATMTIYYRFSGVIASIAVLFNLLIIWAALQNIGATITLAGIAGIILTVGMAVDANVLVFERIREELDRKTTLASAISSGYKKAFSAIFDSNITTIIAALILLNFDAGPIKGFALTLIIGIASSMFTALFMTRIIFSFWLKKASNPQLTMLSLIKPKSFAFLRLSKVMTFAGALIVFLGALSFTAKQKTAIGMDFSGGYALNLEVTPSKEQPLNRQFIENIFLDHGANRHNFQVREMNDANQFKLFFSRGMEDSRQPFYQMPLEIPNEQSSFQYEKNPRIDWIVKALEEAGISVSAKSKETAHLNWTSISGQMSDAMRNNALFGLGLALLCILIYITFRFEFKYAISATLGLAFDVFVTLGFVGVLHYLRVPIQIDLNTVAALMTIIGYSLNDTIIVFDRIREDVKGMHRRPFNEIINHALNVTLSRTLMTSFTTLIVLIALCLFGGSTIFGFSLIMSIGVIVGTLSTFFIASRLLLFFHRKEEKSQITATNIS